MKSIFLCESEFNLNRVYAKGLTEELKQSAGLYADKIYTKSDILEDPGKFSDTEYIFSTWGMPVFEENEIKRCFPNLKCVFYAAGTVQSFARQFLNYKVKVFSAWAANAVPVAQYTAAQIVLALKGYFCSEHVSSLSEWKSMKKRFSEYPGVYGEKVGIIGAGMIGKLVISKVKALGLDCLVFDPFLPDEKAKQLGVEKCTLEKLFGKCFVISNHLANNAETRGMLNYALFSSMRKNSVFINTGRGAQIVEEDLFKILKERHDITALLDVTVTEPPEDGSEFYKLKNCFLTPHIAGSSGNEVHRMAEYMKDEFEKFESGNGCLYEVTLEMLKTMS